MFAAMLVIAANARSVWTSNRVAQWLGDRSYSLYLWHWPIFVALVYTELQHTSGALLLGLLLTLVLAHFSYVWVEGPARRHLDKSALPAGAATVSFAVLLVASPAVWAWKQEGVKGRFSEKIEVAAAEANNVNRRPVCLPHKGTTSPECTYSKTHISAVALGDSHTRAIFSALSNASPHGRPPVLQWSRDGCPYLLDMQILGKEDSNRNCNIFIQWVGTQEAGLPKEIPFVLTNRYAEAALGGNENRENEFKPRISLSNKHAKFSPEFLKEVGLRITSSACEIAKRRAVYLVRPVPEIGLAVPKTLSRRLLRGENGDISIPFEDYWARNGWVWAAQDAARDQCGVKILDPTPYLCKAGRCYGSINGRPLYSDDDHLSEYGNKLLVPMFAEVFSNPPGKITR